MTQQLSIIANLQQKMNVVKLKILTLQHSLQEYIEQSDLSQSIMI